MAAPLAVQSEEPDVAIEQRPDSEPSAPPIDGHGAARRRLAKAGLGAAGILMTLESRATLRHRPMCVTPSASLSTGAASTYTAREPSCNGARGPRFWCTVSHFWPCSQNVKFGDLFRCKGKNDEYAHIKLVDILSKSKYEGFVGRYLATTWLNVMTGQINFLTEETVRDMWYDLQSKGYYEPKPKTYWSHADVSAYLAKTYRD